MPTELSINWLFIPVYGITVIAAIYGAVSVILLALSRKVPTILVSAVLFLGWAMGISSDTPLVVYVFADFVFGMLLLNYILFFTYRWWVWSIGTIYGFMILTHGAYLGIKFLPQITWSQHYWYITALFTVQLFLTGGQIYRERRGNIGWLRYPRRRITDFSHRSKGVERQK